MVKVEELMVRSPRVCSPDDTLEHAARIFWEQDCGSIPVVDSEGTLVGVVTDRDACLCAYFRGLPLCALRVRDAMAKRVTSCWPDDSVDAALQIMSEHRLRRLPVVDARCRLLGFLSFSDLARAAANEARSSTREHRFARIGATLAAITTPHGSEISVPIDDEHALEVVDERTRLPAVVESTLF